MNPFFQQIVVAAAVLGAVLYLALRGRKKKGCQSEGGCGCGTKKPLNPPASRDTDPVAGEK